MAPPQINGEVHSSAFLEHLLRYPVVNDSVSTFKSNQYGQKSLQLGDSAYQTFARPVMPYLAKPYQYVQPYVKRADDIGDLTLSKVDERFPAVHKPTGQLYNEAMTLVLFPLRKGFEGRDHVLSTYQSERKKVGGDGIVTSGKALVTTALIVTMESLAKVGGFLAAKKAEAKDTVNEKANN